MKPTKQAGQATPEEISESDIDQIADLDYPTYDQIGGNKKWDEMSETEQAYYNLAKAKNAILVQRNTIKRLREKSGQATPVKRDEVFGEWQLCPKCYGNGYTCTVGGYQTSTTEQCTLCNGAKMLVKPVVFPPTPSIEAGLRSKEDWKQIFDDIWKNSGSRRYGSGNQIDDFIDEVVKYTSQNQPTPASSEKLDGETKSGANSVISSEK